MTEAMRPKLPWDLAEHDSGNLVELCDEGQRNDLAAVYNQEEIQNRNGADPIAQHFRP